MHKNPTNEDINGPFTERDILIALVNAVLELGERITGEQMVVTVKNSDESFVNVYSSDVEWLNNHKKNQHP